MEKDVSDIFVAIDLGASSGRVMAARFDGERLRLDEVARFPNDPIEEGGHLFWNIDALWDGVKRGLTSLTNRFPQGRVRGIGVDAWGVDYALLDGEGGLVRPPRHYRDVRTESVYKTTMDRLTREVIFSETGIQFMRINSLYQWAADVEEGTPLSKTRCVLMIPDLIHYWLTGRKGIERTIASTTQAYDPQVRDWSATLLNGIHFDSGLFPAFVDAGTMIGPVTGFSDALDGTLVYAVGSHDTASAVAAVPMAPNARFAYLSSGTWSLLGAEICEPVISMQSQAFNFTNEIGVFDTVRLLKNINGLWIVQECQRAWSDAGDSVPHEDLAGLAASAEPLQSMIDPDAPEFLERGPVLRNLASFCERTRQKVPDGKPATLRCVFDSLAMKYRFVLERLEVLLGYPVEGLHVIGGGAHHALLNQSIANSIGRPVLAGPVEATCLGNIVVQMIAAGRLQSLVEGRRLIRRSYPVIKYEPKAVEEWNRAYEERFLPLIS